MSDEEIREALAVLNLILAAVEAGSSGRGRRAAELRRAAGELRSDAETLIRDRKIGARLAALFTLASQAGGRPQEWRRIIDQIRAIRAVYGVAGALVLAGERLAISAMARSLQEIVLRSREDAQAWVGRLNPLFLVAIDAAADQRNADVYRALKRLHAAAVRDLTERGRPLARIVEHEFASRLPSLSAAHRLYRDAGRHEELIGENRVIHPAFMPQRIKALSQ